MPEDLQSLSDLALMRLAQSEDTAAFSVLVERYQGPLLRVARSRVGRTESAEELVQETLLAAYRSRRTFDPRFSFRTWLWTILLNHCKAHASKSLRRPATEPLDESCAVRASAGSGGPDGPFAVVWQKERAALLDQLLDRLPAAQADALRLRFFAGLKFQEIAEATGCSLLTAKNRVRAGLLRLSAWTPHELVDHSERPTSETLNIAEPSAESPR